jgi:hypothetical protein
MIFQYNNGKERNNTEEYNPVVKYLSVLNVLMGENKNFPKGNAVMNKATIKLISAFLFHERLRQNQDLEDELLVEERENRGDDIPTNVPLSNIQLKKINNVLSLLKNRVNDYQDPQDGVLESLIENNYFSIFTQKVLLLHYYTGFLQREEPQILNGLLNIMQTNYENNKYLLWMKLLLIISYYEEISQKAYNNDIQHISYCQSLCDEILGEIVGNPSGITLYNNDNKAFTKKNVKYIRKMKFNLEMIFFQKEIYKYKNMIKNGQIDTGISLFRNVLVRINSMLYKKYFNHFSPSVIAQWGKRMDLMEIEYCCLFNPLQQNIMSIDSEAKSKLHQLKVILSPLDAVISFMPIVDIQEIIDGEILISHGIVSGFKSINPQEKYDFLYRIVKIQQAINKMKKDKFYKLYIAYCKDFQKITGLLGIKNMMHTNII